MATKAAIYVRVSNETLTTENQLIALRELAAQRGYVVVDEISDTMSGAKKARPGLDRLMQGAHRGRYNAVLTFAIDRLGRSMHSVIGTILELDEKNVRVVSIREPWLELAGPTRGLLISIFAWVAEMERETIIARTRAGQARAKAQGKVLGRPRRPVDLDRALRLRGKGLGLRQIATQLGVPSSTLHRALAHGMASGDVPKSSRAKRLA